MNGQADVLAVLRDDFVDASLTRMHDPDAASKARCSEDALAAVAEIIAHRDALLGKLVLLWGEIDAARRELKGVTAGTSDQSGGIGWAHDALDRALVVTQSALQSVKLEQQPAPVDLEQFREAVEAWKSKVLLPLSYCDHDAERHAKADHLLGVIVNAGKAASAEPVAWIRFRSDGGWEGPIHNCQIDEIRRSSGAWTPLYAAPQQPAPVTDDAMREAAEQRVSDYLHSIADGGEVRLDPYDPNTIAPIVAAAFDRAQAVQP